MKIHLPPLLSFLKPIRLLVFLLAMLGGFSAIGQTPGLILKPAAGAGAAILDPDNDGYVSQKTGGIQMGFRNNDVTESEIPYVALVKPDPLGDILSGSNGGFTDIVGTDAAGNNAVLTYKSGANTYFRIRLSAYASNSKSYSILIDTDQKFGFTGPNADPNAVPGNAGYEAEIVLRTNFSIDVNNADGRTSSVLLASYSYNYYCQKSVALSTAGGDPDYFYDFYLPTPSFLTGTSPLRYIVVTGMSPSSAIGSHSASDVGGVGIVNNLDQAFTDIIDVQAPSLPGQEVLVRSSCPAITGPISTNATSIGGTTTEGVGTVINVSVYQSNGTTLVRSGTITTTGANWSINVSSLTPSVALTTGYLVKATATAPGKGVSYDNCDIEIVTDCSVITSTSNVVVSSISGDKGFSLNVNKPIGTIIKCYDSNYNLIDPVSLNLDPPNNLSVVTTTSNPQTIQFKCKTGNCFTNGVFYFTFQEPGLCVSNYLASCLYSTTGTSTAPVITTSPITSNTVSISGTCGSAPAPAGTHISLYADGVFLKSTNAISSTSWTISGLDLSAYACKTITASASEGGRCTTLSAGGVTVTRQAFAPVINYSGCGPTAPTSITGYSPEIGATIELYKTTNLSTPIGTTTVPSNGIWTISTISPALVAGNTIQAKVAAGGCFTASGYSNQVAISTQTNISGYNISINTPTEGQTAVSGTITGGTYPVTLKVYVDEALVGSGINMGAAGNWTVSGLNTFDLAPSGKVQVTLTSTSGCESGFSAVSATVQCLPPADKTISTSSSTVCANSNGSIIVQASEPGVLYTPVADDGITVAGYGGIGNGGNLTLTTHTLVANPTIVKVKASKFPFGSCDKLMGGSGVSFAVNALPAAPTASSPQVYCGTGTAPTLANLAVTVPAGCTLKWYTTATSGSTIASTTIVAPNTTYYAESENTTTGCRSNTRTPVLVQTGTPAAPVASDSQSFCGGATIASLVATLTGPGTIRWFSTLTGGSALANGTALISGNAYYAETLQNTCVSSARTKVNVTVNAQPLITSATGAARCGAGQMTLTAVASAGILNWYDAPTGGNLLGTGSSFTTPDIVSTTTYYVEATFNGCVSVVRTPVTATVNAIPTITVTNAPACALDFLTYSVTVTVSSGILTSTAGTVVNTSGNIWSVSNVSEGTNITLAVTSNGCTSTLPINAPDCGCAFVSPPVSGGDKEYCLGSAIPSITGSVLPEETIDWYSSPTGGISLFTGISYTPSSGGTYYAEARNISTNCKSSVRTPITVSANPVPSISSMSTTLCTGSSFSLVPTNGINGIVPAGTTYSWSAPSGTGFTGGQAGNGAANISGTLVNTTNGTQTATYTVIPTHGSCPGLPFTITVTIHPNASITSVTGTSPLAMGATTTYNTNSAVLGNGTGIWSSSNPSIATVNSSSGEVTGVAPGTCNIIYTISGGCGGTVSALKVITVVPTVSFTSASQTSSSESGSMTITLQLSAVSSQPVTVPFTLSGTADNGTDYTISANPVTIPAGSTTTTISILITNDVIVEGVETIIFTMGTPTNASQGAISDYTATIKDDDFNPANDADGDGIINTVDVDDDNDGILDSAEGGTDADGDGIANWFDLDSDNDGIYDILEAGGIDANFNGKVDVFADANGNGLTDSYDAVCNGTTIVTGRANSIYSYTGNVINPVNAVDADNTNWTTLNGYDASIVVQFQSQVSAGTAVTVRMDVGSTVTIEQSYDATTYTNSNSFYSSNGITDFTYNLTSDANYLRITRKSNKTILIYQITFPYIICNGNVGAAVPDYDSDNDGNKDRIEMDSDNDGCRDVIESGFTDANADGKLDGTGISPLGIVTGNINGYTTPADAYLTSAFDYREANPVAVGGTVLGGKTICSGGSSGTLTLSGYTGTIIKWQSSVSPFTTWTDITSTSTTYSVASLTQTTQFRVVVANSACSTVASSSAIITVRPTPTATISGSALVCMGSASTITFTNPQDLPVTIGYNINGSNPTTINVGANTFATVSVPTSGAGTFSYNLASVIYQTAPTCSNALSGTATVTVVAPPDVVAGTDITICSNAGIVNITGGSGSTNYSALIWSSSGNGTFANATSLTLATYQPSISDITAGTVTLTLTAYGNTPCEEASSTKVLTILPDGSWTGTVDRNWNNPANWACNQLPTLTTNVTIANGLPRYPIVSTEPAGMAHNIFIGTNATVTVTGGTLQIAGSIANSGIFTATEGTIEMKGSAPQTIGANVFSTNTLKNLIINNEEGVTLAGPLNITGVVSPLIGNLSSGGHLTLLSTPSQTALIDGVGTGNVVGNVNIQRYLSSSFGYKYFSSPFQSAAVGAFATLINLTEIFPTFYKYDENNSILNSGVTSYKSGWVKYTTVTDPLIPMAGYAANMGSTNTSQTFTMSGVVNNGPQSLTLYNHNREYTKGFNLVGNPYPSPIDWNALGWTKDKIDNAIYFFNAGNTDRYTGVYSSFVNGISSGNANNIIAAMQGFFVHVSDGTYPVQATLGMTNAVRINTLNPVFKSAVIDNRPTLRLTAGFEIKNAIEDAAVVYIDPTARVQFEKEKDALKLDNTDELVPNIYTITPDSRKLSINGLSEPSDSVSFIPLGITTFRDGLINFRAVNADDLPFTQVYLADAVTGQSHNLRQSPDVRFTLQRGVCDNRFKLVFSKAPFRGSYPGLGKLFMVVRSGNRILVKVDLPDTSKGYLLVTNLLGQAIMRREVTAKQTVEINQSITTGVYVITLVSGKRTESEKILMRHDYE